MMTEVHVLKEYDDSDTCETWHRRMCFGSRSTPRSSGCPRWVDNRYVVTRILCARHPHPATGRVSCGGSCESSSVSVQEERHGCLESVDTICHHTPHTTNKTGVLRQTSLDTDIQALDPNDTPPPGPVWSTIQSKGTVNLTSIILTMTQYCL